MLESFQKVQVWLTIRKFAVSYVLLKCLLSHFLEMELVRQTCGYALSKGKLMLEKHEECFASISIEEPLLT